MTTTTTLSAFVQTPTKVISHLEEGDVLLTRRGDETLRLSKAARDDGVSQTLSALAQLVAASLDDEACDRIADHLGDPFPWVEFLPEAARREFVGAFLRMTRACASVGNFDRVGILVESWKETAAAYADPSLTPDGSDLTPIEGYEPVSDPREEA